MGNPNLTVTATEFGTDPFRRDDESSDLAFYAEPRLVHHLDARARETVERLTGELVVEPRPAILDLMASWDSHLPPGLDPARVVGLGLNADELERNPRLDERVVHDLNRAPRLDFADAAFDVVLNVVSVDYLTRPVEVFAEVRRVLKPGGLFLVVFSHRWFEPKVTRLWRAANELDRIILVQEFFAAAGGFGSARSFVSKGLPRPADDPYAAVTPHSDPVYAVYAETPGAPADRPVRPVPTVGLGPTPDVAALAARKADVPRTLRCPHCGERLSRWRVPQTPFTEWAAEHLYICFNDGCRFYQGGYTTLAAQGVNAMSYRFLFNPENESLGAVPVPTPFALRENIEEAGDV